MDDAGKGSSAAYRSNASGALETARLQERVAQLEQELAHARRSEQMLNALLEYIPEGIAIADARSGSIVRVSRFGQELTGSDPGALEGAALSGHSQRWGFMHKDGVTAASDDELPLTRAAVRGEVVADEEWVVRTASGRRSTILCNAGPIRDDTGAVVGGVVVWRDVTQRRNLQERLHLIASARCLLWHADVHVALEGTLRWQFHFPSMEAAQRFLPIDMRPGQTFADAWYDSRLPEDQQTADRIGTEAIRDDHDYEVEYRCRLADGRICWVHEDVQVESLEPQRRWRLVGVCTDVTDRIAAEREQAKLMAELEAERARLHAVLDQMPVGLAIAEAPSGKLLLHNQAAVRIIRHSMLLLPNAREYGAYGARHPDGTPYEGHEYPIARALAGEVVQQEEMHYQRGDGTMTWLSVSAAPQRDEAGNVVAAISTFQDVAARKEAEAALRQHEALLQSFFAASPGILTIMDDGLRFIRSDAITPSYFGLSPDTIVGKAITEVAPEFTQQYAPMMRRVIETGEPALNLEISAPVASRGGDLTHWQASYFRVPLPGDGYGLGVIGVDITDLKRTQRENEELNDRLRRAMAETHHRVKNNLQIIAALVEMSTAAHGEFVPAEEVKSLSQNVRGLAAIHDLLTAQAREGKGADRLSAQAAMERLMPVLQASLGNSHLECYADDMSLSIRKSTSLAIVVNELVANAVKHAGGSDIAVRLVADGDTARLTVADAGPGFSAGFAPDEAANTGLELVLTLARWDLGGTIRFENARAGGAVVKLEFPWRD